ncbi:MAG: TonB-dependent receptor [Pseudomonadota bacterium]
MDVRSAPRKAAMHWIIGASLALLAAMAVAAEEDPIPFDIEAQPLERALETFAEQTRRQVTVDADVIRGVRSPAVRGKMSARRALEQLIDGTALVVVEVNESDFALRTASARGFRTAARRPVTVDEIIVTGTKQNRSLLDTSTSVAVFTQDRFEREVAFDFDDIILRAPNVSSNGTTADISIRGVNLQGAARGIGVGPTINIYVDGAPLTNFNGIESLWDVDQVEVLRGPQSTIQGRNALAGAVIINTKDPTYDFEGAAQIRIGNNNLRQYSGVVSGPLIDSQVAGRLAVDFQDFEGNAVQEITRQPTEVQEGLTLRGKILLEPNAIPDLRVDLQADYIDTESGNLNLVFFPLAANDPAFDDFDPFGDVNPGGPTLVSVETIRSVARIDYQVRSALSLVGLITYEDTDQSQVQGDINDPSIFPFNGDFAIDTEAYSGEIRLEFDQDRWKGWLGVYYYSDSANLGGLSTFAVGSFLPVVPENSIASAGQFVSTDTENYALFGELRFELSDRWELEVGARYDDETVEQTTAISPLSVDPPDCIVADFIPGLGGLPCALIFPPTGDGDPAQSASFDAFLPRGLVRYKFDKNRSVSFGIQRGYRAGGSFVRTALNSGGLPETVVESFDPEFITNYEIAFRGSWLEQRLVMLLNVFYSDWTDQQVQIPGPSGLSGDSLILNAGSSELYGAEFSADYLASDELSFSLGVGFVKTRFNDFPFAVDPDGNPVNSTSAEFANLSGNEFALSPEFSASAGAYYENSRGFFADATVNYVSDQYSDVENLEIDQSDDFTLVSVRGGFRNDRFEIYAFAENLFDDRAILERRFAEVSTETGAIDFSGTPSARINRPRLFGVGARVKF